jgi:hypothetical protein
MKKDICILLPGKIGDIIICLPIAEYFYNKGHTVHWIVWEHMYSHFTKGNIEYVNFIPIKCDENCMEVSLGICKDNYWSPLDLSFTNIGAWGNDNSKKYLEQDKHSFDEFRYHLANVPFENKWTLNIKRVAKRENILYNKLNIKNEKYCLYEDQSSDIKINMKIDTSEYSGKIIKISPVTDCVFDWLMLIERSDMVLLIESCFTNLIDQLQLSNRKQFLFLKSGYYSTLLQDSRPKGLPILRNEWIT